MAPADLTVDVCWSPAPGSLRECRLRLPAGSTLRDALVASTWFDAVGPEGLADLRVGIWGRAQPLDAPLRDEDRVEVYRALTVDPKEARRQRYRDAGQRIVTRHRPLGRKA